MVRRGHIIKSPSQYFGCNSIDWSHTPFVEYSLLRAQHTLRLYRKPLAVLNDNNNIEAQLNYRRIATLTLHN